MIINQASLNSAFTGFKTIFNMAFEGAPSTYQTISMEVPSSSSEEDYGWLGQFSRLREWVGDRVIRNLVAHSYTIKNRKFEDTVSIPRDKFEDDKFGVFKPVFAEMGRNARTHPDELVYALVASGFATACYDGQYFFDTDHPVTDQDGTETSVSNMQAGAGTPWFLIDNSRAVRPIIWQTRIDYDFKSLTQDEDVNVFMRDEYLYGVRARVNAGFGLWQLAFGSKDTLDATNYEAARAAMAGLKGENGKPLGVRGTHLVVGQSLEGAGRRILVNQLDGSGGSNEWAGTAELIVTPFLD